MTEGGGKVLLMGTEVDNAGAITTPKGQIELAAGHDFILRQGFGTDNGNSYSTTRGNEIATGTWTGNPGTAGAWTPGGGIVDNTGIAFAQQGDITLAGHAIIQDGVLLSTSSVNQRGTIHLLNSASDASGSITLTGNSLALILPELDSSETALNSQRDALISDSASQNLKRVASGRFDNLSLISDREDQSRIEIVTGGSVNFRNGSLTQAQGGQVAVSAGKDNSTGHILVDSGAVIDVSGVQGVLLPMSANEIEVNIQGNELRDSPQNRDSGNLANKDAWIDIRDLVLVPAGTGGYPTDRYYTPGGLLEVSGYLNNTFHGIGEWAALGGTITLSASDVTARQGSTFNIAGGSLQYQSGYVQQTYVLGSDGGIYNINDAPSGIAIKAVVTGFVVDHPHWGVTEIYQSPWGNKTARWEEGYTVGRDAGSLVFSAQTSEFAGDIIAAVTNGERQTGSRAAGVTDGYKFSQDTVALAGRLVIGSYGAGAFFWTANTSNVVFSNDPAPANSPGTVWLNADQIDSYHLGGVSAYASNQISVNDPLTLANGGSVQLYAPTTDIAANITARGGSVTVDQLPSRPGTLNSVTLESGVTIDTRGVFSNLLLSPNDLSGLAFINGGNVTLRGNVDLQSGSLIDASAGGVVQVNSVVKIGNGGDIALSTPPAGDDNDITSLTGGSLKLDGTLRSNGATGGRLFIESDLVSIGGQVVSVGDTLFAGSAAPYPVTLSTDIVLPAGTVMPIAYSATLDHYPPGTDYSYSLASRWLQARGNADCGLRDYSQPFDPYIMTAAGLDEYPDWHDLLHQRKRTVYRRCRRHGSRRFHYYLCERKRLL